MAYPLVFTAGLLSWVPMPVISPTIAGLLAMITASTVWGLSGLYYRLLSSVPVLEVLAHRSLWSLVFFCGVLLYQGRLSQLAGAVRTTRGAWPIAVAAIMISTNWCGFIYSVQTGHAIEASLGYYTFPLVAVALGLVVFGDRLNWLQWGAVALAGVAVLVLSVGLGKAPWIALVLAATFGLYGMVKKLSPLGPLISTAAEVLLLTPIALGWLAASHLGYVGGTAGQTGGVFGSDLGLSLLLMLSGPLTGVPLLLFSFASQRITMVSLGLIQYLNPTFQFLVAVLVFGEAFTPWHMIAFPLIWFGLALYSFDGWRRSHPKVVV